MNLLNKLIFFFISNTYGKIILKGSLANIISSDKMELAEKKVRRKMKLSFLKFNV